MHLFENTFNVITIEFFLLNMSICLLLYAAYFQKIYIGYRVVLRENIFYFFVFSLILCLLILINNPYLYISTINDTFTTDVFIKWIKIVMLLAILTCLLFSFEYLKEKNIHSFEYSFLVVYSFVGMCLFISSYNLISIYLAIELQSLCFYVLSSTRKNSEYSTEASLKYFILGAFSSGLLLFGFFILYATTGIMSFEQLNMLLLYSFDFSERLLLIVAFMFILVSFLFKIGSAPFHVWLPDVYEGSPLSVTSFFAIVPKIATIVMIIRIYSYTFNLFFYSINNIILFSCLFSLFVGSFAAIYQHKVIRLLAYSAISHIGYILLGIFVLSIEAIDAVLLYIFLYIIMSINLYSVIISIRHLNFSVDIKYLKEFIGFFRLNPIIAFNLSIVFFSMAGIPPLAGFFSKFYIFYSALNNGIYILPLVAILTSAVSAAYYLYCIRMIYFEKPISWIYLRSFHQINVFFIIVSFFIIFFFFVFSSFFIQYTHFLSLVLSM